jgi:hypothetical protein
LVWSTTATLNNNAALSRGLIFLDRSSMSDLRRDITCDVKCDGLGDSMSNVT